VAAELKDKKPGRIAWCLTGAGHFLKGSIELALRLGGVTFFLSRSGEEVISMYRLMDIVRDSGVRVVYDRSGSSPACGEMALGRFDLLVMAPATANTVAKCVNGIADTLPTNLFAQAGKALVPSMFLPTDLEAEVISVDPAGREFPVRSRKVDLENAKRLSSFPLVRVAATLEQLEEWLTIYS
jgi:flavoprotein